MHRTREVDWPVVVRWLVLLPWTLLWASWWLLSWTLRAARLLWRACVDASVACCRMLLFLLFGLFGAMILANLLYGMFIVLAYPWLH